MTKCILLGQRDISLEGTQLMFEEKHKDGWNVAEMEYPFGIGINSRKALVFLSNGVYNTTVSVATLWRQKILI